MSRPCDWSPLWSGDPIPGDPDYVGYAASAYGQAADNIDVAAERLRTITSTVEMCSNAIDAFRVKAVNVRTNVIAVQSRYRQASAALSTYAASLRAAQAESLELLSKAQAAAADESYARSRANHLQTHLAYVTDPVEHRTTQAAINRQLTQVHHAESTIQTYVSALQSVIDTRNAAAGRAEQELDDAEATSAIHGDTLWDQVMKSAEEIGKALAEAFDAAMNWMAENMGKISDILSSLSTICTIVGAVCMLIPGLQVIGGPLLAAGRLLQLASTAAKVLEMVGKAYQCATGKMTLAELGGALAGAAAGYVVGKLVGKAGGAVVSKAKGLFGKGMVKAVEKSALTSLDKKARLTGDFGKSMTAITHAGRQVTGHGGQAISNRKNLQFVLMATGNLDKDISGVPARALIAQDRMNLKLAEYLMHGPSLGTKVLAGSALLGEHMIQTEGDKLVGQVSDYLNDSVKEAVRTQVTAELNSAVGGSASVSHQSLWTQPAMVSAGVCTVGGSAPNSTFGGGSFGGGGAGGGW